MPELVATLTAAATLLVGLGKVLLDVGYMRRRFDELVQRQMAIRRRLARQRRILSEHEEELEEHRDQLAEHHERLVTLEARHPPLEEAQG